MFNNVLLKGNITRELELSYTTGNEPKAVLKFTVAFSEKYEKEGKPVEKSNFIPVTVWGKLAESCAKNLIKGQEIIVEGRLAYDHWEDENGSGHSRVYVVSNSVYFGRKPKEKQGENQQPPDDSAQ
jgi:single-strand DNA-binding protein